MYENITLMVKQNFIIEFYFPTCSNKRKGNKNERMFFVLYRSVPLYLFQVALLYPLVFIEIDLDAGVDPRGWL